MQIKYTNVVKILIRSRLNYQIVLDLLRNTTQASISKHYEKYVSS